MVRLWRISRRIRLNAGLIYASPTTRGVIHSKLYQMRYTLPVEAFEHALSCQTFGLPCLRGFESRWIPVVTGNVLSSLRSNIEFGKSLIGLDLGSPVLPVYISR